MSGEPAERAGCTCKIKDVPVFVLSLIGCVGWLTFTISMAVAFSDMNEKYRALNSVTFVHYAVAALGLICTLLYVWYASNLSQLLRALCTLLSTVMLVLCGGSANDFGRLVYECEYGTKVEKALRHSLSQCKQANKAAIAGAIILILSEMLKLQPYFSKKMKFVSSARQQMDQL